MGSRMPDLTTISTILGVSIATVGLVYSVRRLLRWWRPLRISPGIRVHRNDSLPDQICATVTNVSGTDQVLVRCSARTTCSVQSALLKHIKRPLTPPRLYTTIWFAGQAFALMGDDPIRLAPNDQERLSHSLSNHPLSEFLTSMFLVEAELSNGQKYRSKRMLVPRYWLLPREAPVAANPASSAVEKQ